MYSHDLYLSSNASDLLIKGINYKNITAIFFSIEYMVKLISMKIPRWSSL